MMRIVLVLLSLAVVGCVTKENAVGVNRTEVLRDVEGYAIASCLAFQSQPYLKDQGDGWASVIVQRGKGGLDPLLEVAEQVKLENAKGDMAVDRDDDAGVEKYKTLPVLYCAEMIDRPSVRAAIQKAIMELNVFYMRQ